MIPFEEFWTVYPRKVGRIKAEKIWRMMPFHQRLQAVEGLHRWLDSLDWADILYIPYPATFLNQRRFEEQPTFPRVQAARPAKDYSQECAEILKRHPDLA